MSHMIVFAMPSLEGAYAMRNALDDLRALPRWTDRLQLMREHLFPAAVYMREVYAPGSQRPLPVLYVQRALRGLVKWLS